MSDYEVCRNAFRDACSSGQMKSVSAIQASISKPKNLLFLYDCKNDNQYEWDTVFHLVCKNNQLNCLILLLLKIQKCQSLSNDSIAQKQTSSIVDELLLRKDVEGRTALDVCLADKNDQFVRLFEYFHPQLSSYQTTPTSTKDEEGLLGFADWMTYLDKTFEKFPYFCFLFSVGMAFVLAFVYLSHAYHHQEEGRSVMVLLLYFLNFLCQSPMWYFTYKIFTTNPGFYDSDAKLHEYQHALDDVYLQSIGDRYSLENPSFCCHICRVKRSPRAGHSRITNKCVEEYDHFCYFLWCDIGKYNYDYFMCYLVSIACFTGPSLLFFGAQFLRSRDVETYPEFLVITCKIFLAWTLLMWLMVLYLLAYHCYIARKGLTTREYKYFLKKNKH